jgi:ribosome-associated protein
MSPDDLKNRDIEDELIFSSSRSSGPGGQNVNKVNTRVELRFNVLLSERLSAGEKDLLVKKLKNKINSEGELILVSSEERSQLRNKLLVIRKFYELVSKALTLPIKRKRTYPTLASRIERVEKKRIRGIVKKQRGKSDLIQD